MGSRPNKRDKVNGVEATDQQFEAIQQITAGCKKDRRIRVWLRAEWLSKELWLMSISTLASNTLSGNSSYMEWLWLESYRPVIFISDLSWTLNQWPEIWWRLSLIFSLLSQRSRILCLLMIVKHGSSRGTTWACNWRSVEASNLYMTATMNHTLSSICASVSRYVVHYIGSSRVSRDCVDVNFFDYLFGVRLRLALFRASVYVLIIPKRPAAAGAVLTFSINIQA